MVNHLKEDSIVVIQSPQELATKNFYFLIEKGDLVTPSIEWWRKAVKSSVAN